MSGYAPVGRDKLISGLLACVVALCFSTQALAKESVRAELIRLQSQTGLTFGWVDNGVQAVNFKKRTAIRLKNSLDVFRPDGFSWEKFPSAKLDLLCWSHDQSKVAGIVSRHEDSYLEIFDMASKTSQVVEPLVQYRMHFTSQCWSPDDKRVAYEVNGNVRVFDFNGGEARGRELANGTDVTWSPAGNWIAFRDGHTYYAIHPNGEGKKELFSKGNAVSALYWSPDSRIVAYVVKLGYLQGGPLHAGVNRIYFRRLEDGSDDRSETGVNSYDDFHWFNSPELVSITGVYRDLNLNGAVSARKSLWAFERRDTLAAG
jgi:WD40 repeat protein